MSASYRYGDVFFSSIGVGSARSADCLVPMVMSALDPASVVDIGCGRGAWLRRFFAAGTNGIGVDGDYVRPESLLIPADRFRPLDITAEFDLGQRFDLAVCLEVGEHIPPDASGQLVANLVRHAPVVLFSAAVPGQGGENHINERPLDFWRGLFGAHGFRALDAFRPRLAGRTEVEPWYRYNVLLYVREDRVSELPHWVRATELKDGEPVPDLSSPLFRLRKHVLLRLPRPLVTTMARTKHRLRTLGASLS
ncbi:MAG TPA: methyltransferase domain-containing protein [Devosia sp.]|nr:methyltransferase domain-containing protein [Devosia sp.]